MTTRELLTHRPDILAVIVGFIAIGIETYAVITLSMHYADKLLLALLLLCATIILLHVINLIRKR